MKGTYDLFPVTRSRWCVVVHWCLTGQAMIDGDLYPGFAVFAGSRRRCKAWLRKLRDELRKEDGR